jgi:PAS domain S-box-containing protein
MSKKQTQQAVVTKALDGRITSWTPSAEAMFGYSAKEATGKHISIIIPFDYQDEEYEILDRIKLGQKHLECLTVRRGRDGRLLKVKMTVTPLYNDDGKVATIRNEFQLVEELSMACEAAAGGRNGAH